ncbi:MAG: hypothetical protein LQ340_002481 [Diploschistes diacapsis]|nr:MAG: hypothetical protein LQ340_002481 [Diploschistes diacapsis]
MATLSDDTFQAGLSQIYESGNDIAVILLEVSRHMRCERVIECMTDFKARWGTSTLRVSSIASWNSREKFQDERGCWQDTALEAVLQEAKQIWLGKYAHWVKLDLNLEKANPSPPVDISWRQMRR